MTNIVNRLRDIYRRTSHNKRMQSDQINHCARGLTADAGRYVANETLEPWEMKRAFSPILLTVLFLVSMHVRADLQKQIVGATEVVFVKEANMSFKARVDTGAKTSSIHAENIEFDSSGDPSGKPISFYLVTREGQSKKVETHVISVVKVKTSAQSEYRFVVPLHIKWNDLEKIVSVTLNDRRSMEYRILLGRNWLRGDFIVDVNKNNED